MEIVYNDEKKDLPVEQLHYLFEAVGWSSGEPEPEILRNFNKPFINSSLVISAWENEKLIGAVRVLSDLMFRSVIFDLLVAPEYQGQGIGKELVRRCLERYPDSSWLVQTENHIAGFYESIGFEIDNKSVFLEIPNKWVKAAQSEKL